jgi:rubrerythrin
MKFDIQRILKVNVLLACVVSGSISQAKPLETVGNLQKAYIVEANAFNKYGKYADQAENEGYPVVAKLFRTVAFSEIIHSRNHSAAIEGLGGKPNKFELTNVKVASTEENLESAAKDEHKDELAMYANYIEQAAQDGLRDAKNSFKFASDSEIQHRQLFAKGLKVLGPKNVDYYVDVKNGDIVALMPGEKPPKSKYDDGAYVKAAY